MDEDAGIVILQIENFTPELERDVTVQFFTINGSATGIIYSIFNFIKTNDYCLFV